MRGVGGQARAGTLVRRCELGICSVPPFATNTLDRRLSPSRHTMAPTITPPVFLASFAAPSSSKAAKGRHVKVAAVQPLKGKGKKPAGTATDEIAVGVDGEGIWRYDVSTYHHLPSLILARVTKAAGGVRG